MKGSRLCALVGLLIAVGPPIAAAQCTHGDLDGSGTVDLADYALFVDCVSGPGGAPAPPGCGLVDFDGDMDVDVRDFGTFQRLFGVTLGMLFANPEFGAGDFPASVATGDLDGDGDLDLAVANIGPPPGFGTVSVLLNHGDGTFADDMLYGASDRPFSLAIGDLDGDGDLDLAVANFANDHVSVLLNQGDGTFADDALHWGGDGPFSVAIGDLDGDGDLDLAVANLNSDNVSVLLGGCIP